MSERTVLSGTRHAAVRIGELKVARNGAVLYTIGLGSCVCVALYDAETGVGGMAHVMLPSSHESRGTSPPGRFADTAVPALVERMADAGASARGVAAKVAGGAAMFASVLTESGRSLGSRNVEAVRTALDAAGVPLAGEHVGGEHGRSVFLDTSDGRVLVRSARFDDVAL